MSTDWRDFGSVEIISDHDGMSRIEPDWERLWLSTGSGFPCTHPRWLMTWYKAFEAEAEPLIICGIRNGSISGIAPMMHLRRDVQGISAGTVAFAAFHTVDYSEVLAAEERDIAQLLRIAQRCASNRRLHLQNVRADTPTNHAICGGFPNAVVLGDVRAPYVSLATCRQLGLESLLTSKSRYNFKREQKLAEASDLAFSPHWEAPNNDALMWFAGQSAYLQLAGLRARNLGSNFGDPRLVALYSELLGQLKRVDMLNIATCFQGRRLVAFRVGFVVRDRFYDWLTGYDRDYAMWSPGKILLYVLLKQQIAGSAAEFDMMRGDEEYKWRWAREYRSVISYEIAAD